jgi:hypothetical protein
METAKVSRLLLCSRSTALQVTWDTSEIPDRSSKARTKERSSRGRIQSFASVGNRRKGLLSRHSVTSIEIHHLFSFVSSRPDNRRVTALCPIYLHQCIVAHTVILLAFIRPRKRVCRCIESGGRREIPGTECYKVNLHANPAHRCRGLQFKHY